MNIQTHPLSAIMPDPLLQAVLNDFSSVARFYRHNPREPAVWERMRNEVRARALPAPRQLVAGIVMRQNRIFGSGPAAFRNIEALTNEETLVVVTGQQTGLFTGPLYTIYKAITAIKLAEHIERRLHVRVVPVFWMAADDHDFAEINHAVLCTPDAGPVRVELPGSDANDRRSASARPFGDAITAILDRAEGLLADTPFQAEVMAILRAVCQPQTSLSDGFAHLMARLFHGRGLILIDPTDSALKTLMQPVFDYEISHPLATTQAVLDASAALAKAGFHAQIERAQDAVNLFLYRDGRRAGLHYHNGHYHTRDGQSYAPEALQAMARSNPEQLSHNVVTRPIVQDSLFPALAYVGGPAEIGYYAQLGGVYEQFGLPFPVVYPRASLTLIEPRTARIMDRLHLTLNDFAAGVGTVFEQRLRDEMPDALARAFTDTRSLFAAQFDTLGQQVGDVDPSLLRMVEAAQRKSDFELDRLEDKTIQAIKRHHHTMREQLMYAENQVYPYGQPQERVANIWPYIARHGFGFMDTLFEAVDVTDFSHRLATI